VREVAEADRAASNLVLIGWPDAAAGRADLARAGRILAQPIEVAMDGRINGQVSAMRRISGVTSTPCSRMRSTSALSAQGSSTTPLPMTEGVPRTIPLGSRESL